VLAAAGAPPTAWMSATISCGQCDSCLLRAKGFGEAGIVCLRQSYPLIMDETNYWNSDGAAQNTPRTVLRLYEKLGISWFSLDGKGSANHLKNEILPDL
jgi:hypothetical protein